MENEMYKIEAKLQLERTHEFGNKEVASCTGFSTYEEDVVSIGEDGKINLLNAKAEKIIRTIG